MLQSECANRVVLTFMEIPSILWVFEHKYRLLLRVSREKLNSV